jgi:hypothetical protein
MSVTKRRNPRERELFPILPREIARNALNPATFSSSAHGTSAAVWAFRIDERSLTEISPRLHRAMSRSRTMMVF